MQKPQDGITFRDVFLFVAGYWRPAARRLAVILFFVITAALVETNLPNALAAFLGKIRIHADAHIIYLYLGIFAPIISCKFYPALEQLLIYNRFETRISRSCRRAFAHVHSLSERSFINTFAGSIISRITRARNRIENFEDEILLRVL